MQAAKASFHVTRSLATGFQGSPQAFQSSLSSTPILILAAPFAVYIVLLIGIVKKNGIMLVDFAVHAKRERGMSAEDAINEACLLRLRPILMITVCAMLGCVPLALAQERGQSCGSRLAMRWWAACWFPGVNPVHDTCGLL